MLYHYDLDYAKRRREEELGRLRQDRWAAKLARQEHPERGVLYRLGDLLEHAGEWLKLQSAGPPRGSLGGGHAG
jgi:hypothetical protein